MGQRKCIVSITIQEEEEKKKEDQDRKQKEQEAQQDIKRRIAQQQAKKEAIKPKAKGQYMTYAVPPVTIFENTLNKEKAEEADSSVKADDLKLSLMPLLNVMAIQPHAFHRDTYHELEAAAAASRKNMDEVDENTTSAKKRTRQLGVQGSSNVTPSK